MHGSRQSSIRPELDKYLIILSLALLKTPAAGSKSVLQVQFGTVSRLNRERPLSIAVGRTLTAWFQDPGNKTPGLPDYRFFPALSSECSHAPLHQQDHLVAASPAQTLPPGNHSPGLLAHAPR